MIFLCFSSVNRNNIVNDVRHHLSNYGFDSWYDYHELTLGDNRIQNNLVKPFENKKTKYVILFISEKLCESACAMEEIYLIRELLHKKELHVFPILYKIKLSEIPYELQDFVRSIIYNEIDDKTGSFNTVNQIIAKILRDELNNLNHEISDSIDKSFCKNIKIPIIQSLLLDYCKLDKRNFNSRFSFLYSTYKIISFENSNLCDSDYLKPDKIIEYLFGYTQANINFDWKELIIAELCIKYMLLKYKHVN